MDYRESIGRWWGDISPVISRAYKLFWKKWGFIIVAGVFYFAWTAYYMGPSVTSCTTTVYGFGDNTAGPIWRDWLPGNQNILGSHTNMTNYPYGDNLYSPVGYSLVLQTALIRGAQDIAGNVCGYNLVNIASFVVSALVMFGFIYALTKKKWIALLAGYAVAFSPYYQMKVGGHPSYGFQAVFIGLIWLFYRLLQYRRKRDAVYLGILLGLSFYFDPYFALLSGIAVFSLVLAWLYINRRIFTASFWKRPRTEELVRVQSKFLLLASSIAIVIILPLITLLYTQGRQINADVAAARGNVLAEARACSNWPHEYFVPFAINPIFETLVGKSRYIGAENALRDNFSCGIGEDSINLSLTLSAIVGAGLLIFVWERMNRRRLGLHKLLTFSPRPLLLGVGVMALVAVVVGFPPLVFHGVPTPSHELISITSTWRTLTRVYVLVNISLVIIASVVLAYLAKHFSRSRKLLMIGFVIIFLGVVVEYQAFEPFKGNTLSTFSYTKDVPAVYTWLKSQSGINVIAEYPLEREGGESDAGSYYLSMQVVHEKKLFNSALSNSPQEKLRSGLKKITDPQTLRVLRAYGVDAVIVHGVPVARLTRIAHAKVVYEASQSRFNLLSHTPTVKYDNTVVLSLIEVPKANFAITLGKGFTRNTTIIGSAADWQYEAVQDSTLDLVSVSNGRTSVNQQPRLVCFEAKMSVPSETDQLTLIADGKNVRAGEVNGQYMRFEVNAKNKIILHDGSGHNMRVTQLGCDE
jgi:hypothetical protein